MGDSQFSHPCNRSLFPSNKENRPDYNQRVTWMYGGVLCSIGGPGPTRLNALQSKIRKIPILGRGLKTITVAMAYVNPSRYHHLRVCLKLVCPQIQLLNIFKYNVFTNGCFGIYHIYRYTPLSGIGISFLLQKSLESIPSL